MKRLLILLFCSLLIFAGCEVVNDKSPLITTGEFPFLVEYEIDGETFIIEDTIVCEFSGFDNTNAFSLIRPRTWDADFQKIDLSKRIILEFDKNTESYFTKGRINAESRIIINCLNGGYFMGDPDDKEDEPKIIYVERYYSSEKVSHVKHTKLTNKQLYEIFGIKINRFEFSKPLENKFE